jgi:hypothetical protein
MMRRALALLLAVPLVAASQQAPAPLAWIHGEWAGSGEMFGRASSVSLSVKPALNDSATELHYVAELPASNAAPAFRFEGKGVYRVSEKGKVAGQWSDSQGNLHSIGGNASAGRMSGGSQALKSGARSMRWTTRAS